MTLEAIVAYPFQKHGRERISANDFVAALSLDRGWFDPAEAEQCLEAAAKEGLIERRTGEADSTEDRVRANIEYAGVSVPEDLEPDSDLFETPSVFEESVERLLDAGLEKREAVAGINRLQDELALTLEAAAVVFARRNGVAVADLAGRARAEL